jgi:parvulin-like peptidyl-prolyl isomerase
MMASLTLHRIALAIAFAALVACATPAAAQVVARVNGAPITNEQLDRTFSTVLRERKLNISRMQDPAKARELKRVALDRLIQEELFWQQARKDNVVVPEAEVEKAYAESMAKFPSKQAFELQLIRQGTDENGFRSNIRRLLSADRYAQRVVEQRVKVTDADIEAFYKLNAHLFGKPEMLKVRTIAIAAPATKGADERRSARLRLEALRQELVAGGDFAQSARQHSDDPTRQWGGELDPAPLENLPEWMRGPVAKLKPGAISPVIETPDGYHLLKLDARIPATKVPLEEARQGIHDHLASERGRSALDAATAELRAAAKVEILIPL